MNMIIKYVYDKSIRSVIGDPIFINLKEHQEKLTNSGVYSNETSNYACMDKSTQEWVRVDKGKLIGVIVALSADKIGWSKCDGRDHFSKRIGKDIAMDRAIKANMGILPKRLKKDFEWVKEKASKRSW